MVQILVGSPLPFGIQLFTDIESGIITLNTQPNVSIAFRHSALH